MTLQTPAPLESYSLPAATSREAYGFVLAAADGDLNLNPPYQRGAVWITSQQIALVHSWLRGIPVPNVTINSRRSMWWTDVEIYDPRSGAPGFDAVIDGQQRIRTALAWFAGEFAVPASWFPAEDVTGTEDTADGPYLRFDDLTKIGRTRFKRHAHLPCVEAKLATLREEAEIYQLVNGGGTPQTDADMARAARVARGE